MLIPYNGPLRATQVDPLMVCVFEGIPQVTVTVLSNSGASVREIGTGP